MSGTLTTTGLQIDGFTQEVLAETSGFDYNTSQYIGTFTVVSSKNFDDFIGSSVAQQGPLTAYTVPLTSVSEPYTEQVWYGAHVSSASENSNDTTTFIMDGNLVFEDLPACYMVGTRIRTERGEIPVEALREGDMAVLANGGKSRVVWVGHRRMDDGDPVRVTKGAFGVDKPTRDLLLSPDHALFLDGYLIPVRALIDGVSIVQERWENVAYYHVEIEQHDILLAEGLAAESYLDTGNRSSFSNGAVFQLSSQPNNMSVVTEPCAPLLLEGAIVQAILVRLKKSQQERSRKVA